MSKSIMELVAAAKAVVPAIGPEQAAAIMGGDNVLVVDVRDDAEVAQSGKIAGALHVPRGMLEFRADAATPYHDPAFAKDKTIIVYCASGGRAALAGKALLDLGYGDVRNLGGFQDWAASGGAVERP
jgi:rhodanese-related sulfurtransferase